jgi:hypothetical protein
VRVLRIAIDIGAIDELKAGRFRHCFRDGP